MSKQAIEVLDEVVERVARALHAAPRDIRPAKEPFDYLSQLEQEAYTNAARAAISTYEQGRQTWGVWDCFDVKWISKPIPDKETAELLCRLYNMSHKDAVATVFPYTKERKTPDQTAKRIVDDAVRRANSYGEDLSLLPDTRQYLCALIESALREREGKRDGS